MKSKKRKKIILLAGFCLLLVATGVLNIVLNKNITTEEPVNSDSVAVGNFFTNYRTDRTNTRNEEIMYLDAIIASTTTSAEGKANAEQQRAELLDAMNKEVVIEGLIKSKGFEDVVISTLNNNISVIVKSAELTSSEVSQIVEVIQSQTNYSLDNIKIIPVE